MDRETPSEDTRILVLEVPVGGETIVAGILADKVHEVVDLDETSSAPMPRVGTRWQADFVRGIARKDDGFVIIPDVVKIFETLNAA
jgi:purine-binding chemotaxis protein CheW